MAVCNSSTSNLNVFKFKIKDKTMTSTHGQSNILEIVFLLQIVSSSFELYPRLKFFKETFTKIL